MSDPVIDLIHRWAKDNMARIHRAWGLEGGWEGWAQVELALFLKDQHAPEDFLIQRECKGFKDSNDKIDICIVSAVQHSIFIELKCESFDNGSNFGVNVFDDYCKVENGVLRGGDPKEVYVIGISISRTGNKSMDTILGSQMLKNQFRFMFIMPEHERGSYEEVIWWYKKRVD
jgi:hypothetical protein